MNNQENNCQEYEFDVDVYFNGTLDDDNDTNKMVSTKDPLIQCLGIDLGTTTSCVAVWREDLKSVEIIPDKKGNRIMPSMVSFGNFTYYVGHEAKSQRELNPTSTFYEVKRLMGKKITDSTVIADSQFFSYSLGRNYERDENNIYLCIGQDCAVNDSDTCKRAYFKPYYTPEEISSMILSKIKDQAVASGVVTTKAVITVPAYFNNMQRKATQDAAAIAGLECIKIINEPTAAACAYGLEVLTRDKNIDLNVIVYDLGGGTLDVSLLNISNGIIEVLGCSGNTHLGGSDFDAILVNYCIEQFIKKNKLDCIDKYEFLNNISSLIKQKLKMECEAMKIKLSYNDAVKLYIPNFYNGLPLNIKMTKIKYQDLCNELLLLCLKPVNDVIKESGIKVKNINEVILVGGGTRMPMVKRALSAFFDNKVLNDHINPEEVVAVGAAVHGHGLCNKNSVVSDNILLLDIIPLSLGVETLNNLMSVIVPRNTTIPTSRKRKYTTCENNANFVTIKIFEGERSLTKDNFLIGSFDLTGIEPEMRGIPEIEVVFNIDANGIVNVLAQDVKNKENKKSITVNSNTSRLSKDDIDKMIQESLEMKNRDRKLLKKRENYYAIEDMCNNVLINLNDIKDKLTEEKVETIKQDINTILDKLKSASFENHKNSEYLQLYNGVKCKYGTLILKLNKEDMNFQEKTSTNSKFKAANIYDDDDNDNDYFLINGDEDSDNDDDELSEDKEMKIKKLEAKDKLVTLCNDTLTILISEDIGLEYNDIKFLREYIDDCMMWVYVCKGISLEDYEEKIKELNLTCDKIMSNYENQNNTNSDNNISTIKEQADALLDLLKYITDKTIINDYENTIKKLEEISNDNFDQEQLVNTQEYLNKLIDELDTIVL
jgi:molecular chaperone DnaK (HSP70)